MFSAVRGGGTGGHPRTRDRLRAKLAEYSFLKLLLIFVAILAASSAILATGYLLTRQPGEPNSWFFWFRQSFMVLTGVPLDAATVDTSATDRQLVQALASSLSVFIPAVFLGGALFKLLLSEDMFVFREKIAIASNPLEHDRLVAGGRHLAIRIYSASQLELVGLSCTVVSENQRDSGAAGRVRRFRDVTVANPRWPVATKHVPRTIQIPLDPDDVSDAEGRLELVSIQGHDVSQGDSLRIQITGTVPELGTEFTESHSFAIPDAISDQPFASIEPDDRKPAREWSGWGCFEESASDAHCAYVFGYGSLIYEDKPALVGAPPGDPARKYGHLRGYERRWNVAIENVDHAHDHKYYVDSESGERPPIRVATLSVEPAPGCVCNGIAIPVNAQQLARLDRREHFLARTDVSGAFDSKLDRPLFAYVATPAARATFQRGLEDGNVFVSSGYVSRVHNGFAKLLGEKAAAEFDATTSPPACPERELRLVRAEGEAGY